MDKPDWLIGLRGIGNWELHWWGERWILSHDEIAQATSKIEVMRNTAAAQLGVLSGVATIVSFTTAGLATPIVGGTAAAITAGVLSNYEIFKSRIKSADRGNGVIVDFGLSNLDPFLWISELKSSSAPSFLNACNIYSRENPLEKKN